MNTNTIQGNWDEIKGKIKTKWGQISEDEIETLKGNLDQLAGKIQKAYGHTKDQAESEYKDFKASLTTAKEAIKDGIANAAQAVENKVKDTTSNAARSANTAIDKTNAAVDTAAKQAQNNNIKHV